MTPLQAAINGGHWDDAIALAEQASPADVQARVPSGCAAAGHNAVHLLARHRDAPWRLVQRIAALGASAGCLGDPNPNGNTALHVCGSHNNTWCAWALLDAGAGRDSTRARMRARRLGSGRA